MSIVEFLENAASGNFFCSEKATNSDHSQLFKSASYKIIQISMIFLELFKYEKNKKNEKAKNCCEIAYYFLVGSYP